MQLLAAIEPISAMGPSSVCPSQHLHHPGIMLGTDPVTQALGFVQACARGGLFWHTVHQTGSHAHTSLLLSLRSQAKHDARCARTHHLV
jgi:hypothetical protein